MANMALLRKGLEEMGTDATDAQIELLRIYADEIELWNRRINLVKAVGDDLLIRHVFDSLAGFDTIRTNPPAGVLDVGSGAGFPGIVVAIMLPQTPVTLLDRSAKRTAFLRNVKALLRLENCEIVDQELERHVGTYDLVCCRAFRPLSAVFEELTSRLEPGGTLLLYKGKKETVLAEVGGLEERFQSLSSAFEVRIIELTVPYLPEERHLLLFRDTSR